MGKLAPIGPHGANIEIRSQVGAENLFDFGLTVERVRALREQGYRPTERYERDAELAAAIEAIAAGTFSGGDRDLFEPVVRSLLDRDEFLVLADFRAFVDCQDRVDAAWLDVERWLRMSVLNCLGCGVFSSDHTVRGYCRDIWHVAPVPVPPEPDPEATGTR